MDNIRYINRDLKAIRTLLLEIGQYRYDEALELMKIEHRPLSMDGFYLEANDFCTFLCYVYPMGYKVKIMKVDDYERVPVTHWERTKIDTV